jgi:hypothetical protein
MSQTASRNLFLYRKIQESFNCNTIVDASKNPLHFYYLYSTGYFRLLPVVLVREGEGYLESSMRRGRSFIGSLIHWLQENLSVQRVLKEARMTKYSIHVRYNDFISNPDEVLKRICDAADLPYDPEMLSFYDKPHHNIAGTVTRFHPRPINDQESSGKTLKRNATLAFKICAGPVWNRLFGA